MEGDRGMHKYLQGSHVDVPSYYNRTDDSARLSTRSDTLRASNYDKLLIKSGFPDKAKSNVEVGDRFYFNGPHMWQTTYAALPASTFSAMRLSFTALTFSTFHVAGTKRAFRKMKTKEGARYHQSSGNNLLFCQMEKAG
eukprot:27049-Rhodomonas_salina.2